MGTTRIDQRGRVTIPKEIRERLGLDSGDELEVELDDGSIRLRADVPALETVSTDRDWGPEAFMDAGEATFGGERE